MLLGITVASVLGVVALTEVGVSVILVIDMVQRPPPASRSEFSPTGAAPRPIMCMCTCTCTCACACAYYHDVQNSTTLTRRWGDAVRIRVFYLIPVPKRTI